MFTIFFCSRVYSVLVHTCQAGGTEEWHYLCVAGQNSQIFLFCFFVKDWSHVSNGGRGSKCWWRQRKGFSQMLNIGHGFGFALAGLGCRPPQIHWYNIWIAPFAKTYLSPTRMPGKTSSEILRTLPALPISITLRGRASPSVISLFVCNWSCNFIHTKRLQLLTLDVRLHTISFHISSHQSRESIQNMILKKIQWNNFKVNCVIQTMGDSVM